MWIKQCPETVSHWNILNFSIRTQWYVKTLRKLPLISDFCIERTKSQCLLYLLIERIVLFAIVPYSWLLSNAPRNPLRRSPSENNFAVTLRSRKLVLCLGKKKTLQCAPTGVTARASCESHSRAKLATSGFSRLFERNAWATIFTLIFLWFLRNQWLKQFFCQTLCTVPWS